MNYIHESPDNQRIRIGDVCVIYISEHQKHIVKIEQDNVQQTKFGLIRTTDLIDHPYGTRFECKNGWVLPLRLTPELWTKLLPHRTQILYHADISMILLQLDIKPGSIVLESGTGSGSLSHSILRALRPHGFLYTYDINESRVQSAQQEFIQNGFSDNVKVSLRNICELGYGPELEGKADACILDLPQTWNAIEHAYKALRPNGSRLCTFSPCVEQVKQNVAKMTELKFKDIVTIECLLRPFLVHEQSLRVWDESILKGLAEKEAKRIEDIKGKLNPSKRIKIADGGSKRLDNSGNNSQQHQADNANLEKSSGTIDKNSKEVLLGNVLTDPKLCFTPNLLPTKSFLYAKQFDETVSHTGYLTFASKRA